MKNAREELPDAATGALLDRVRAALGKLADADATQALDELGAHCRKLQSQARQLATVNARAAELAADLEELNAQLSRANAHGAELMAELEAKKEELQHSLDEIRTLRGILPICSHCHQIRDDQGYWNRVETYISQHSDVRFSHGICPACIKEHYADTLSDDDLRKLGIEPGD